MLEQIVSKEKARITRRLNRHLAKEQATKSAEAEGEANVAEYASLLAAKIGAAPIVPFTCTKPY